MPFNPYGLLLAEREAAHSLQFCLLSLHQQASNFESALALFDFCEEALLHRPHDEMTVRRGREWKHLAARSGAVTLYNFAELIQSVDGLIGDCPTVSEHKDDVLLKTGRAAFYRSFPSYVNVRFGVAHAGKPHRHPEESKKHRPHPDRGWILDQLDGRVLRYDVNGKTASYSLTAEALTALRKSAEDIDSAFAPVSRFTMPFHSGAQRHEPTRSEAEGNTQA